MDNLLHFVQTVNSYLSDYILVILLIGVGLWYSIKTNFVQVRCFKEGMKKVFGNLKLNGEKHESGMSSFQALATAIAAQVGTGNIVGASGAILTGGPGAIFWMWVIAFFGMATIYAEAVLAQKTRIKGEDGQIKGGPVYYITTAFKGGFGKFLAGFFAIAIILALGFFGCMVQSNSIGSTCSTAFGIPSWVMGAVLVAICGFIFLGGVQRLASVTEKIVPIMAAIFLLGGLAILIARIKYVPATFGMIFKYAFKPQAIIGGGFGAKQTAVCEVYPAFVTWKTKKPSKLIFTREESQIASTPRHEMEIHLRLGANKDGRIRGLDLYTLSNTGAYGEHGPTTVGLSGHKSIPLYSNAEAFRFTYDVVYTNHMSAGAYRGYGATQGLFAVESAVNELAAKLHMDPFKIREMNIVHEGDVMPAYYGAVNTSCTLDRCLAKVHEMINWDEKYPRRDMGNGKIRAVGMGMAMQGSGISGMDVGSATLKVNDEGFYTLLIGAADMGTGCDTTLAQIAAEVMECDLDNITVFGADTDTSPYDSGSYASSTTYITGKAVEKCALKLRSQICKLGAQLMDCSENDVEFDGKTVFASADPSKSVSLGDIATASMFGHDIPLEVTETHMSPLSPPPYMVGAAEVEVDTETGEVKLLEFDACVDCGTPINPNLTRVQAEGGILQGIGMTLTENVTYDQRGWPMENSLMQYKIPTRVDVGKVRVEFENSYEPNGPFGAKSIGEVVINTPLPAISDAICNAIGTRFYELPITPEKIAMAVAEKEGAV